VSQMLNPSRMKTNVGGGVINPASFSVIISTPANNQSNLDI